METVTSYLLRMGTSAILDGDYAAARLFAAYARYFEQYMAVVLKETQALPNWPKLCQAYYGDDHTLVKFYRHRIPCSCLDEKYEDVKHITKMGCCYNQQCSIPNGEVERCKSKYCSRCRYVTYCSSECQEADWKRHKPACDRHAEVTAEFEAKQQT